MRVSCENCKYAWDFNGQLMLATCPNCSSKVKVPKRYRPVGRVEDV